MSKLNLSNGGIFFPVCICIGDRVYVQFSAKLNDQKSKSRRKAKGSRDHFLSVPGIHVLESVISKWNRRTPAQNKIRESESHRLQASHYGGGRALGEDGYRSLRTHSPRSRSPTPKGARVQEPVRRRRPPRPGSSSSPRRRPALARKPKHSRLLVHVISQ